MENLERHPLSQIFVDCSKEEFIELKDSIEDLGVLEPIVMFEGKILDGWQRYTAARELAMKVPRTEFMGDMRAAGHFVLAKHARRNVTREARALAVAQVNAFCAASPGRPKNSATMAGFQTVTRMATQAGVSQRTMHRALTVTRNAIPEVRVAVQRGELEMAPAARIAVLPASEQPAALVEAKKPRRPSRGGKTREPKLTLRDAPQALPREQTDHLALQQKFNELHACIDELNEKNNILIEENDRLVDRLAVIAAEGPTDEERLAYGVLLADLRAENKTLRAELNAVKATRDHYMTEASEAIKQCQAQAHLLRKATAGKFSSVPVTCSANR